MKRLIAQLVTTLTLIATMSGAASAFTSWSLRVDAPQSPSTSPSVNVEYKVLSVDPHDFAVSLYEDGSSTAVATNHTQVAGDPNTTYGNSGAFTVTLPDGHHTFHVVAVNQDNNSDTQSANTAVDVDATAPGAPIYGGKTQSGNNYVVSFTAPSDSDVVTVKVFASTSKTYTADASTLVGTVSVSPSQAKTFSYTAPDSTPRYFSVQAFDAAGNGSPIVGDPGTVVTPVRTVNTGGTAGTPSVTTAAATGRTGQVQGVSTTNNGEVNATGQSKTNTTNKNGKVLGTETSANNASKAPWYFAGGVLLILVAAYYWFFARTKGWLGNKQP